jgi:tektin-3
MQDKLHGDLEHKDMALEIDRDCHEMHNDAIDIKHHDGIEEEDVSGSVPQSWAKFSKNNVEESQGRTGRELGRCKTSPCSWTVWHSAT